MIFSNYETVFIAIFLLVLVSFAAGYLGGYVRWWATSRKQQDIDYRLTDLEARLNREVKVRAHAASMASRNVDQEILELAKNAKANAAPNLDLTTWRASRFRK